jgi:hypothetical protein
MFERAIGRQAVMEVIRFGEVIFGYPDDDPFPSCLMLGYFQGRPLHVVVAVEALSKTCYIVTAYDPDPSLWNEDFRTRRPS